MLYFNRLICRVFGHRWDRDKELEATYSQAPGYSAHFVTCKCCGESKGMLYCGFMNKSMPLYEGMSIK